MKNVTTRATVLFVVLVIATFTQPAAALPRYSYSDIYYTARANVYWLADGSGPFPDGTYCVEFETGRDTLSCSGVRDRSGTLDGRFRHYVQYECSSHTLVEDQWYFYTESCGGRWIAISDGYCYKDVCAM
jgi:hypothetical protein